MSGKSRDIGRKYASGSANVQSSVEIIKNDEELLSRDIFRESSNTNGQQEKNISCEMINIKTHSNVLVNGLLRCKVENVSIR